MDSNAELLFPSKRYLDSEQTSRRAYFNTLSTYAFMGTHHPLRFYSCP